MLTKGITYEELITSLKKGLRNGNWRKLGFLDKALFRAAMWYAKSGVSIVNGMLVEKHFFQKEIFTKETILNYFIHKNKYTKYSKVRKDTIRAFF